VTNDLDYGYHYGEVDTSFLAAEPCVPSDLLSQLLDMFPDIGDDKVGGIAICQSSSSSSSSSSS